MQINSHMDPQLVDKIVHEVKSQGVFDEFRKDSMADVDTKPAYQNLRQRVENTVKNFLSEQKWSPEMNKNQLRERLRKHITDSGFLDVGVERIVDQVVNPKIGTVFQPKIEDIAYKYLCVPKPVKFEPIPMFNPLPPMPVNGNTLKIETSQLLPTDLEQVSPDSDKGTVKSEPKDDCIETGAEDKVDEDDESPPFEPLEQDENSIKKEDLPDIKMSSIEPKVTANKNKEGEHLPGNALCVDQKAEIDSETQDTSSVSLKTEEQESDKDLHHLPGGFQESQSQISQVSSNSHASIGTQDNNGCREFDSKSHDNAVNISEEAQMPKFSENSNDENTSKSEKNELHFDINQDKIKFEGTKRKSNLQPVEFTPLTPDCIEKNDGQNKAKDHVETMELGIFKKKEDDDSYGHTFKFNKINIEPKEEQPNANETSFNSSLDDSGTAQLCIVDKSENTQISESEYKSAIDQRSVDKDTQTKIIQQTPTTAASNIDDNSEEKFNDKDCEREELTRNATSPSAMRHRKHSKHKKSDKDSSREKERARDKDKFRHRSSGSRLSSSSSKHHPSSSKPSSSGNKSSNSNEKGAALPTSQNRSKHSSSSSRSKSNGESKRSAPDSDKRHHSTSSKDRSSSSSQKKSERKSTNQNDDHYASKEKMHWRKSTDSTDEDKKPDGVSGKISNKFVDSTRIATDESKSKNGKNGNSSTISSSCSPNSNTAKYTQEYKAVDSLQTMTSENVHTAIDNGRSKIVILNEILENPKTDFIDIASEANQMHIARSDEKSEQCQISEKSSENELWFFESNTDQFSGRLQLIDNVMDICRKIVDSLRSDYSTQHATNYMEVINSSSITAPLLPTGSKRDFQCSTRATLHIDCIQYNKAHSHLEHEEEVENKRYKYLPSVATLVSPTPSETSVNSKENEFISADITAATSEHSKKSLSLVGKRNSALNKFSQQRYSSDDLYKPRPVLGQRSRRRGLFDTIV